MTNKQLAETLPIILAEWAEMCARRHVLPMVLLGVNPDIKARQLYIIPVEGMGPKETEDLIRAAVQTFDEGKVIHIPE